MRARITWPYSHGLLYSSREILPSGPPILQIRVCIYSYCLRRSYYMPGCESRILERVWFDLLRDKQYGSTEMLMKSRQAHIARHVD